jgi:hypothetical protein
MNRALKVVRLQLINRQTFVWIPLIILFGSLAISLLLYGIIQSSGARGVMISGGVQAPLWYFGVIGAQALTRTFPFSQAMSVTRGDFFVGTLLTAVLTAGLLSVVFVVGGLLEQATNGYGMNGWFFYIPWAWEAGPVAAGIAYFALAMFAFVVGFWAATIFKRFGGLTTAVTLVGVGLALVAAAWLITATRSWATVGETVVTLGAFGLAVCGVVITLVLAASSFATLRRAIP